MTQSCDRSDFLALRQRVEALEEGLKELAGALGSRDFVTDLEVRIEALEASPETFQRISSLENDVKRLWQQMSEPKTLPAEPEWRAYRDPQIRELYAYIRLGQRSSMGRGDDVPAKMIALWPWLASEED